MTKRERDKRILLNFAKDVATNYDCECHHGRFCRACKAIQTIKDVLGDECDEFLKGPYLLESTR